MIMRTLQHRTDPELNTSMKLTDKDLNLFALWYTNGPVFIAFRLVRENNRGWTFVNHSITGNKTTLFFSRGEYEMVEE